MKAILNATYFLIKDRSFYGMKSRPSILTLGLVFSRVKKKNGDYEKQKQK